MRDRIGLYVCPVPGCPSTGRKGAACGNHDRKLVRQVYSRERNQGRARSEFERTIRGLEGENRKLADTLRTMGRDFGWID